MRLARSAPFPAGPSVRRWSARRRGAIAPRRLPARADSADAEVHGVAVRAWRCDHGDAARGSRVDAGAVRDADGEAPPAVGERPEEVPSLEPFDDMAASAVLACDSVMSDPVLLQVVDRP